MRNKGGMELNYNTLEFIPDIMDRMKWPKEVHLVPNDLTDRQREIFELYFNQGNSMNEVAKKLSISKSTVQTHLNRIKSKRSV